MGQTISTVLFVILKKKVSTAWLRSIFEVTLDPQKPNFLEKKLFIRAQTLMKSYISFTVMYTFL